MKRLTVCAVIAAVMILGGIHSLRECERVSSDMIQRLDEIQILYKAGDVEAALGASERAADEWERFCAGSVFLTGIERSLEIQSTLIDITGSIAAGNDETLLKCAAAKRLIESYNRSRKPAAENIF